MTKYLYKLKHKYVKNHDLLTKYGFIPYKDEEEDETFYTIHIKLNKEGAIFNYLIRALEKIYTHATTKEREEDFTEYEFTEILTENQERDYKVKITPELEKELGELKSELFKLKFSLATNGLDNPMKIKEVKKDIARINTVLTERKLAENK